MEEIVVGGGIAGIIRYFPGTRRWEPVPRPEACALFTPGKRYVIVADDAIPFIRDQHMSVLAPGLMYVDDAVQAGDEVFILGKDGSCIGVGRAKADAADARAMKKGPIVRTRRNIASEIVPGISSWDTAITANAGVLADAESSSIRFVQEVASRNPDLPVNVSYSGGKDSLSHPAGGGKSYRAGPDALCRYRHGVSRNVCQRCGSITAVRAGIDTHRRENEIPGNV